MQPTDTALLGTRFALQRCPEFPSQIMQFKRETGSTWPLSAASLWEKASFLATILL